MAGFRLRIGLRNNDGVKRGIHRRARRIRGAWAEATVLNADDEFQLMQAECPRLTHYMALHMLLEFKDEGLGYFIGWAHNKFVGEVNPVTNEVVTTFYPIFVINGTRFMAGNNFPAAVRQALRARILGRYRRALAA